jgi:hypothetical protein
MAQQPGQLDLRRQLTGLLRRRATTGHYFMDSIYCKPYPQIGGGRKSTAYLLVSTSELHLEALVPLTVKSRQPVFNDTSQCHQ